MKLTFLLLLTLGFSCTLNHVSRSLSSGNILDKSGYLYDPSDRSCDGFPKLQVETKPGTCLGLVLSRDNANDPLTDRSFIKPRTIVQIPKTDQFLIIDMGGWKPNNGRLFWLRKEASGKYGIKFIKFPKMLDAPHGLRLGPDGYFYVGEKGRIIRFKFENGELSQLQTVVKDLPSFEGHMHPLTQFIIDPLTYDLFINSGAPSDHCFTEESGDYKVCPEGFRDGLGAIYRVSGKFLKNLPEGGVQIYEIAATGLRNSMAMAIHPSGKLLQAENSRDFPEFEEPYEELNIIELGDNQRGKHYGWPYCYNFNATSPEWLFGENQNHSLKNIFKKPVDCSLTKANGVGTYQSPYILLPPHVAPLDMLYYKGGMFSDSLNQNLIMSWHGHQPTGNRIVAFETDDSGLPILNNASDSPVFKMDNDSSCPQDFKFKPRGGLKQSASYTELVSGWSKKEGIRPEGSPVGMTVAEDGSLWIVEDRNARVVLRLARTNDHTIFHIDECTPSTEDFIDPNIKYLAYRNYLKENPESLFQFKKIKTELIQQSCLGCHGNLKIDRIAKDDLSELDFMIQSEWFIPQNPEESKLYGAIAHIDPFTPMPPKDKKQFLGTPRGDEILSNVKSWIMELDHDLDNAWEKLVINGNRFIRNKPTTKETIKCGKFLAGDVVYLAGGAIRREINADGWIWRKILVQKNHTRLFENSCQDIDQTMFAEYWMAIKKQ